MRPSLATILRRCYSSKTPYFEEIKIPVPWGHLAAKWWGPQDKQPILTFHGWQENCNSFDPLMKMLPADLSFLAFDMPGNGWSTRYPTHGAYHVMEDVTALRALVKHYQFKKPLKFLLHSFSIGAGIFYAASYPKEVDRMLAIDFIKPFITEPKILAGQGHQLLDKLVDIAMDIEKPKEASLEALAESYRKSAMNSLSSENSKHLLERMTAKNPETGLYSVTRDPRIKLNFNYSFPNDFLNEVAKNIRCKILYIKASKGLVFESPRGIKEVQAEIEKAAEKVEYAEVDGTHHVHMEKPHLIAPYVLNYLCDKEI